MADLATLEIKVDAGAATRAVQQFGVASDQAAAAATRLQQAATTTTTTQAQRAASFQAETARLRALSQQTVATGRDMRGAAAAVAGGFGVGGIATLALIGFASAAVSHLRQAREEAKRLADDYEQTVRRLVNAGDNAKLRKLAQDLYLGTPAPEGGGSPYSDGIVGRRRRLEAMRREQLENPLLGYENTANALKRENAIRKETEALAKLEEQFKALKAVIEDPATALKGFSGPLPWMVDAPRLRDAADEVFRQVTAYERLAEAAARAGLALSTGVVDRRGRPIGLGASIPSSGFGRSGYTPGDPVMGLPSGIGTSAPGVSEAAAWSAAIVAAFANADDEIAKNFQENIQRSIGDFFGEFVSTGRLSIRDLFSGLQGIGGQLAGQAISSYLTPKFGEMSTGAQIGAGVGLSFLSGLVSSFLNAGERARELAMAFAETTRNVRSFAAQATETPEEATARRLREQTDDLARQAVAATGYSGFTGGLSEAQELARTLAALPSNFGGLRDRGRQLLELLGELEDAFAANAEAALKAAAAERVRSLTQTLDSLAGFRRDLRQSDLSIYNPFQQQEDARAYYQQVLNAARGGDESAAANLPAAARAFLEQSRAINASGTRYVADFKGVEADTAGIQQAFDFERQRQEAIVAGVEGTHEGMVHVAGILTRTEPWIEAQLTVAQSTALGTFARLDALIIEQQGMRRDLTLGLERLESLERAA